MIGRREDRNPQLFRIVDNFWVMADYSELAAMIRSVTLE
jgi:hypothetical protein